MVDLEQLRVDVIRPALMTISMGGQLAEDQVLATGMAESNYTYIRQMGDGPALSFWQIEPATHDDAWDNYLAFRGPLRASFVSLAKTCLADEMLWNMRYAAAMCRLKYYRSPKPLSADVNVAADLWLTVYNAGGKGTKEKFVNAWHKCGLK